MSIGGNVYWLCVVDCDQMFDNNAHNWHDVQINIHTVIHIGMWCMCVKSCDSMERWKHDNMSNAFCRSLSTEAPLEHTSTLYTREMKLRVFSLRTKLY